MKKTILTVLSCVTALVGSAQTLSNTPVSTFEELEDGGIYALKTINDKASNGGWYYRNNNFYFTLNPNDVTPGSKVSADNNKYLWKVYKNTTDQTIALVNMYDGVYMASTTGNVDNINSNNNCDQNIGYLHFEASTKHEGYSNLYILNGSNKYYATANNGGKLGYWTLEAAAGNQGCVQFYKINDPENIALSVTPNKPCLLRIGDGEEFSVGGYIYATDGSALTMNGQTANLSTLGSEWIFEGDYANGFKIVNASSKKVLGVNTSNLATNERTKLALYDADNTDSNVSTLWDVTGNTFISGSFNLHVKGSIRDRVNDNSGLAFWKTGVGKGSALRVYNNVDITLTEVGSNTYATTYLPFAVTVPEGINAYTATINNEHNSIELTKVEDVIPAETGVILEGTATSAALPLTTTEGTASKGGLVGTLTNKTITAGTTDYLVLGTKDGALGFYLPNAASTSIGANKAYFELNGQASAMGYAINFGTVTGIASATINKQNSTNACYDLSGRRITSPVKSGLYISNGKKIIVK